MDFTDVTGFVKGPPEDEEMRSFTPQMTRLWCVQIKGFGLHFLSRAVSNLLAINIEIAATLYRTACSYRQLLTRAISKPLEPKTQLMGNFWGIYVDTSCAQR